MTFIKALIKAITNIVNTAIDFIVGPFITINTAQRNSDEFDRAAFSVVLRVLFLLGVFGCGGLLIALATWMLTISMWLTVLSLCIETVAILTGNSEGTGASFKYKYSV